LNELREFGQEKMQGSFPAFFVLGAQLENSVDRTEISGWWRSIGNDGKVIRKIVEEEH
jgi:hypothetical protein